jgi:uncharacterized membrane protein
MEEQTAQPTGTQPQSGQSEDKDVQDNKLLAALSYLWILSVVMLLVKKDSKFVQFHAKQGLVLFLASIVVSFIPFLGWFLLNPIVGIVALIGLIQALMGKYWKIPLVSDLAEKINL